jgi:hypothetical protein
MFLQKLLFLFAKRLYVRGYKNIHNLKLKIKLLNYKLI